MFDTSWASLTLQPEAAIAWLTPWLAKGRIPVGEQAGKERYVPASAIAFSSTCVS